MLIQGLATWPGWVGHLTPACWNCCDDQLYVRSWGFIGFHVVQCCVVQFYLEHTLWWINCSSLFSSKSTNYEASHSLIVFHLTWQKDWKQSATLQIKLQCLSTNQCLGRALWVCSMSIKTSEFPFIRNGSTLVYVLCAWSRSKSLSLSPGSSQKK